MITNFSLGEPEEFTKSYCPRTGYETTIEQAQVEIDGEFLVVQDEERCFYFLCTDDCDIEKLFSYCDWYIVSSGRFQFIQDYIEWIRGAHQAMDYSDRLVVADLKHNAAVMAWFVYNAAMRDEMMPRKPQQ